MYSELLRRAVAGQGDGLRSATDQQLQTLLEERRSKMGPWSAGPVDANGGRPDAAAEIALQLEYDLVLLELCRARGIASDPDRFSQPVLERRRLERALTTAVVSDSP
jgi:hypothetical protein